MFLIKPLIIAGRFYSVELKDGKPPFVVICTYHINEFGGGGVYEYLTIDRDGKACRESRVFMDDNILKIVPYFDGEDENRCL